MANLTGNEKYGNKNVTGLHNIYVDELEAESSQFNYITFTKSLNDIDTTTFSYIDGLVLNAQEQIDTANSSIMNVCILLNHTNMIVLNTCVLLDHTDVNILNACILLDKSNASVYSLFLTLDSTIVTANDAEKKVNDLTGYVENVSTKA